jgi:nicotinamide-nucleotide amidase
MGSIVAYANAVKQEVLGVQEETLKQHGAVSEETVREMVSGALKVMKTDLAVSISGIAGPGGGSSEKPVGTIWMAVGNTSTIEVFKLQTGKDRLKNIQYAGNIALNLVRKFVLKYY